MRWEYQQAEHAPGEDFAEWLNDQGGQGWELVTLHQGLKNIALGVQPTPVWIATFKRPVGIKGRAAA